MTGSSPLPYHQSDYWVLVADGSGARVYVRSPENKVLDRRGGPIENAIWAFTLVTDMDFRAEVLASYDLGVTARSTVFQKAGELRHLSEPHVDVRQKLKRDLAKNVALALNEAKRLGRFDELVVIAPASWIGFIRPHLSSTVTASLAMEVAKDFTSLTQAELNDALNQLLPTRNR